MKAAAFVIVLVVAVLLVIGAASVLADQFDQATRQ